MCKVRDLDEKITRMCGFDDPFFNALFQNNKEAGELLLNTLLRRKNIVLKGAPQTQKYLKNLYGTSMRFDFLAEHAYLNEKYNDEVQRGMRGANPKRLRMNSSLLDAGSKCEDSYYRELSDNYVLMITEHDYYGTGRPYYEVKRMIGEEEYEDGKHILYVNGEYQAEDPIGLLMHDLHCQVPEEMHYKALRDRAVLLKRTKKGKEIMSTITEEIKEEGRMEGREEGRESVAIRLLQENDPLEKIQRVTQLSKEEINRLKRSQYHLKF